MRKADLAKNRDDFEQDIHWYEDFLLERMLRARRVLKHDDKVDDH